MFHASANNLDDLTRKVFIHLLAGKRGTNRVRGSRKGDSTEAFGALLELTDPRARLGRTFGRARVFSPLGELLWYLSGSNELAQILHYVPSYHQFSNDGKILNGAYGPRIFSPSRISAGGSVGDQWQRIIEALVSRSGTRNAVIQVLQNTDANDENKDIPCTCTLQFVIREGRLHLHVHMRSNDVVLGFPHDVFAFTMLQEIAARELGCELGRYHHSVASLHLYDDTEENKSRSMAMQFLEQGLPDVMPMPPMPKGDPWPSLRSVLLAEKAVRHGVLDYTLDGLLDPYWHDLIILLQAYATSKADGDTGKLEELTGQLSWPGYRVYMLDRIARQAARSGASGDLFEKRDENAATSV